MRKTIASTGIAIVAATMAFARPVPNPALAHRLADGPDVIGIVHWGLNTYTDREWGYGDEDPALLNPAKFDADQIVEVCKAGGIDGLVIVAKHHDGFCLWPTKTTGHNITKAPFRDGKGDYVREMEQACRRAGLKFGVYVSPWDRNNEHYATEKYVELYHEQLRELLGGDYGEVFEMWFNGANGGDGWYGGAKERRTISKDYYRFGELMRKIRAMQPGITVFGGGKDGDFRWPGNERGILDPDSRATSLAPGAPGYREQLNTGTIGGTFFLACESDFPLRRGWFYHKKEDGSAKNSAYLAKLYLSSVGNGGTMDIGIAPTKDGIVCDEDIKALEGFKKIRDALFANEVTESGKPFNLVVMKEDLRNGEQIDDWCIVADGREILSGKAIGKCRIRLLREPVAPNDCRLVIRKDGGQPGPVTLKKYFVNPELAATILDASADSRETDTAIWMTK